MERFGLLIVINKEELGKKSIKKSTIYSKLKNDKPPASCFSDPLHVSQHRHLAIRIPTEDSDDALADLGQCFHAALRNLENVP